MFEKARAGDSVYCLLRGPGTIVEISTAKIYSIKVVFEKDKLSHYTVEGKDWEGDSHPVLYWHAPEIKKQQPPCDIIERTGWVNIYKSDIHMSPEVAAENAASDILDCINYNWEEKVSR